MSSQELVDLGMNYFLIPVYFLTLMVALYHYKKYFDTVLKLFPIIIAYTFFNELLGHLIRYSSEFAFFSKKTFANDLIYNIYDLFFYGFFYYVYWKLIHSKRRKKTIKILALTVLASYLISCCFQNPLTISLYYATSLASWVLALIIILYFSEKSTEWNWQRERSNLMFWVSLGLLLFSYIFPFLFFSGYLKPELWYAYNFQMVLRIIIVIMYGLFITGFVISHRRAFH
ncbi:MAG: hypothetical protein HRT65_12375 [Flavobacteriaceae bacterium]|nr:hypothetical protein [Flavobacteriaceae bacterium]